MRFLTVICGIMCLMFEVQAQETKPQPMPSEKPMVSTGDLQFFVDTGVFRGPDQGVTRLEAFVLIDAKQFSVLPDQGRFTAQYDVAMRVVSEDRQTVKSQSWTRNLTFAQPPKTQDGQAPYRDRIFLDLPPGKYHMSIEIDDMFGDQHGACQDWVVVDDFEKDALMLSDLVVAGEIGSATDGGRFVRYNWQVVPNTTRRFLIGKPVFLYYELYHLIESDDANRNAFVVEYSLTDSVGTALKKYPAKLYRTSGPSAVQTTELPTGDVEAGIYWVQVAVFDRAGKRGAQQRRRIILASLKEPTPEMSEEQAKHLQYYKDIRYVANAQELKQYEVLPASAQMNFLRQFWKTQDPTPETPVNERLIQHIQRMSYVETNFSRTNTQEPIDTDRGRVYIKYGPPDDIERNASSSGDKPFEVWHYGRHQFIFRDPNGLGVYRLVHSTYPGEIYNPDWQMQTY